MRRKKIIQSGLTVLLFLALGLVSSVAVAWGATVRHDAFPSRKSWRARLIPPRAVMILSGFDGPLRGDDTVYTYEFFAGWPALALRYANSGPDSRAHGFGRRFEGAIYGGLDVSRFGGGLVEYLPRQPMAANLLLDTIFWATVWLLLCTVGNVVRLKRWIGVRRKKRCGWCHYDLRDIPARQCPECGRVIERWPALFRHPARWPAVVLLVVLAAGEFVFINTFISNRAVVAIHRAAFEGDLEAVQAELDQGTDIDLKLMDPLYANDTPLLLAALNGHADIVEHLLARGADPAVVGMHGNALTAAIRSGNTDMALRLIEAGVPLSTGTGDWLEPLTMAIQADAADMVAALLDAGADVTKIDFNGFSPLDHAVSSRRPDTAARLRIVRQLLAAGADPNFRTGRFRPTPLVKAIFNGYLDLARELLEAGADPDDHGTLKMAASMAYTDPLDLLVEFGADLSANDPASGESLLWEVTHQAYFQSPDVWRLLVEHGADVNTQSPRNGRSLLIEATLADRIDFARFLVEHGADPTIVGNDGLRAVDHYEPGVQGDEWKELLGQAEAAWIAAHGAADEGTTP